VIFYVEDAMQSRSGQVSDERIDGTGDIPAERDAREPEETLPVGGPGMPAADPRA